MPCLIYEKNERDIDKEMLDSTKSKKPKLSPIEFTKKVGYQSIYELRIEDYMLLPPGRNPAYIDTSIDYIPRQSLKGFTAKELVGLEVYKMKSLYN